MWCLQFHRVLKLWVSGLPEFADRGGDTGLGKNRDDMIIPEIKRRALLKLPVMPLIDPRHASPRSADMVQNCLGDFEANAQPLKSGSERSAKVVQPPRRNRIAAVLGNQSVNLLFSLVISCEPTTG